MQLTKDTTKNQILIILVHTTASYTYYKRSTTKILLYNKYFKKGHL